jgi:hypothetical protein
MGETRVDLLHLLEDLRDAYPGPSEETILADVVANSLDSEARTITLATDPAARTLTIVDDGRGMRRRELARYHDVAASTKIRGDTIGFAGIGIKIALLVSAQVVTETRAGRHHVATTWGLASRHRAPWKWTPPPGIVAERGTAIRPDARQRPLATARPRLCRDGPAEPLRAAAHAVAGGFLATRYPQGVRLVVNGRTRTPELPEAGDTATISVRLGRQRKAAALGWLVRVPGPLAEDRVGLAVSTFGKVIKRGWEWLGLIPGTPERLTGGIEVPARAVAHAQQGRFHRAGSYRPPPPLAREAGSRAQTARRRYPPSSPRRAVPAAVLVAQVATGSRSTSNTGRTIPSSPGSWNRPSGSTTPIPRIAGPRRRGRRAITWPWRPRWLSRHWPWNPQASMDS